MDKIIHTEISDISMVLDILKNFFSQIDLSKEKVVLTVYFQKEESIKIAEKILEDISANDFMHCEHRITEELTGERLCDICGYTSDEIWSCEIQQKKLLKFIKQIKED